MCIHIQRRCERTTAGTSIHTCRCRLLMSTTSWSTSPMRPASMGQYTIQQQDMMLDVGAYSLTDTFCCGVSNLVLHSLLLKQ
jgi:hypothetical protein